MQDLVEGNGNTVLQTGEVLQVSSHSVTEVLSHEALNLMSVMCETSEVGPPAARTAQLSNHNMAASGPAGAVNVVPSRERSHRMMMMMMMKTSRAGCFSSSLLVDCMLRQFGSGMNVCHLI